MVVELSKVINCNVKAVAGAADVLTSLNRAFHRKPIAIITIYWIRWSFGMEEPSIGGIFDILIQRLRRLVEDVKYGVKATYLIPCTSRRY